jgi:large subunit ribosomal protein L19
MKAKQYTKETIRDVGATDRNFPDFRVGDTIAVEQKVTEGDKSRIQLFEGDVIAYRHSGISTTFTVRRIGAHGVAVERIFPYYSPLVQGIRLIKKGDVRRARLYYLRKRVGRAARIKEQLKTQGTHVQAPA